MLKILQYTSKSVQLSQNQRLDAYCPFRLFISGRQLLYKEQAGKAQFGAARKTQNIRGVSKNSGCARGIETYRKTVIWEVFCWENILTHK